MVLAQTTYAGIEIPSHGQRTPSAVSSCHRLMPNAVLSSRKIIVNIHRTSTRESCFSSSAKFGRIRGSLCVQQLWWALLYFDVSSVYFRQSRRNPVCYLCLFSLQCLKLLRNLFFLLYNCRCRNKGDICVIIWQKYFITCTKFDRCFGRKSNHHLCSQNTDLDMILFSFCFSFLYFRQD